VHQALRVKLEIAESRTVNIQDAYNQWAESYDVDANPTRDLDARVLRSTLADLRCERALEIGCGTGKNTVFLAEIAQFVLSLDFSTRMLAKAAARVDQRNVSFTVADLKRDWPCQAGVWDLVSCSLVLEHVEDLGFIFSQASESLRRGGRFFVCELHPSRQYLGTAANFTRNGERVQVPAYTHHISEYLEVASRNGFKLHELNEWWSEGDAGDPPRLVSFLFEGV
jgi:malonyl-CoA O-methyltransferase